MPRPYSSPIKSICECEHKHSPPPLRWLYFFFSSGDFNVKPRLKHLLYTRIKNFIPWFICALFLPTLVMSKRTTCPTNNSNSLTSSIPMTCPSISLQLLYTTLWIYHNFELPGIWLNKQEDFWIYGSSFQLVNSFLVSHYAATGVWGACCNLAKSASLLSIPCPFWSGWSSVVGRSCDCLTSAIKSLLLWFSVTPTKPPVMHQTKSAFSTARPRCWGLPRENPTRKDATKVFTVFQQ